MSNWQYGNAWEEFPIEPGQVWGIRANGSRVAVHNIFDPLPYFMNQADLLFVDPPWNQGNINAFYTKAGRQDYQNFDRFADVLYDRIAEIGPQTTYIEIGRQYVDDFYSRLGTLYPMRQCWPVVYYRKHPTWIIRGSRVEQVDYDFTGIDEAKCIDIIAYIENYTVIGDLCMGRGLVGLAAHKAGKRFVGTELNKRRLANLLQKLARKGAKIAQYQGETACTFMK